MNDSPEAADTTPEKRRRWHALAIATTMILVAIGTFLNVPGEPVIGPAIIKPYSYGVPDFRCFEQHVAHGWPLRFLKHLGPIYFMTNYGAPFSPWELGRSPEVTWWKLFANVVIILSGSVLMGWLVNRHITRYGSRFGLANIAAFLLVISCVLGFGTYRYRLQQAQLAVIVPPNIDIEYIYLEWEPLGPYWLRSLTGEEYWSWGDRLMSVQPASDFEVESFPGKSTIQVMTLWKVQPDDPPSFEGYDSLVALSLYTTIISEDGNKDEDGDIILKPLLHEIGKCRTLQGLNLLEIGVKDRDLMELSAMPQLLNLELSRNESITDAGLEHLASIKSLRRLSVRATKVTKQGVEKLQAELPECEIEWDGMDQ